MRRNRIEHILEERETPNLSYVHRHNGIRARLISERQTGKKGGKDR